jgi:uncharacterized protein (TIGR01777 family)
MPENKTNEKILKKSSILITGGSGLVGRYLTSLLLHEGYKVSHLSRSASHFDKVKIFQWDPERKIIDPDSFEGIDYVVHLAGANIGEKRWTRKRKEEIIGSRVDSAKFLYETFTKNRIKLQAFISASAVGYYGLETSNKIFREENLPSNDFLGITSKLWEETADLFLNISDRVVKIRTAVVLEKNDSALSKLMEPGKFGFLVQTGNGFQYMPWIHIQDLCNIYLKAIEDSTMSGAYNAVSPQHVTYKYFIRILSKVMHKPIFPVPVPSFILKIILGEMSDVILKGSRVSSEKLEKAGYRFIFRNLEDALKKEIC